MALDTERAASESKRKLEEDEPEPEPEAEDEEWIGPMPSEAAKTKKRKGT